MRGHGIALGEVDIALRADAETARRWARVSCIGIWSVCTRTISRFPGKTGNGSDSRPRTRIDRWSSVPNFLCFCLRVLCVLCGTERGSRCPAVSRHMTIGAADCRVRDTRRSASPPVKDCGFTTNSAAGPAGSLGLGPARSSTESYAFLSRCCKVLVPVNDSSYAADRGSTCRQPRWCSHISSWFKND